MELALLKSLLNKEFYDEFKGDKCPHKLFSKDLSKIKTLIDEAMDKYRQHRIDEYLSVKDGVSRSIYVHGDLERDAFEISRRIEAVDMLLEEYTVAHKPFDFESVEWWDDKEGLNE